MCKLNPRAVEEATGSSTEVDSVSVATDWEDEKLGMFSLLTFRSRGRILLHWGVEGSGGDISAGRGLSVGNEGRYICEGTAALFSG